MLCAGYFCVNFIFRWAAYAFFSGHGAYGWSKPSTTDFLAMSLGVLSSTLTVFVAIPWCLTKLAEVAFASAQSRRLANAVIVAALILAIVYAEADNTWYALSKEHLRYADIEIFFQTNPVEHLGLSAGQVVLTAFSVLVHIPILWASYLGISGWRRTHPTDAGHGAAKHRFAVAALVLVVGAGFIASLMMVRQKSDQWAAIARHNVYDLSASRFVRYRHPDAEVLDSMMASLRQRRARSGPQDKAVLPQTGVASPPIRHILIIAMEGWNARFFETETMPFLSELSKQFMVFPNHYSSGNNTLLGVTGIAYGQSPAFFFEQQAVDVVSEPIRKFRDSGFSVRRFGYGLNSYRNIESYLTGIDDDADSGGEKSSASFPLIRQHLKGHDRTLSLFYYGDTHYPYRHAPEYSPFQPEIAESSTISSGITPREIAEVVNRYRNSLHEADAHLREFFASIEWKSMLVVITGDHGESMMENGRISHSSSLEQPQIRTPMLLYFPGVVPHSFGSTSSHVDIMPTAMQLAGLGSSQGMHGSPLLDGSTNRRALVAHNNQNSRPTQIAVVSDKSKLILDASDLREVRVFDLLAPDDRVVRLQEMDRADVERSLEFFLGVLASSGCLRDNASAAMGTGPAPLRHCRAVR